MVGLEQPVRWKKGRVRGLRLFGEDASLLAAIGHGEFALNGFRNRDLQPILAGDGAEDAQASRKRSAAIGRKLRMLPAHRLIRKIPKTHRYQLTQRGRQLINALDTAKATPVSQLLGLAA